RRSESGAWTGRAPLETRSIYPSFPGQSMRQAHMRVKPSITAQWAGHVALQPSERTLDRVLDRAGPAHERFGEEQLEPLDRHLAAPQEVPCLISTSFDHSCPGQLPQPLD